VSVGQAGQGFVFGPCRPRPWAPGRGMFARLRVPVLRVSVGYALCVCKPATMAQAFWISSRFNGTISFSMPMQNSFGVILSFPSKSMTETGREKSTSAHLFTSKCRHTHAKKLTYKRVDHAVEACPEPVLNCSQCPLPPIDAPSLPPMHTHAHTRTSSPIVSVEKAGQQIIAILNVESNLHASYNHQGAKRSRE
jgi:hypothetical protein